MSITQPHEPPDPPTWGLLTQSIASIADNLAIIAAALVQQVENRDQAAPNLERRLADYASFDWQSIGAIVLEHDSDGATAVEWRNRRFTRRAPANKFGEAIWFSRAAGKDDNGDVQYERLIIFREVADADPLPAKVKRAAVLAVGETVGEQVGEPAEPQPPAPSPRTRGANGPQRIPADAAILTHLDARERHYLDLGFSGLPQNATYALWTRPVNNLFGPEGRDYITARLAKTTVAQVEYDKWLPAKARLAAMLEWLMEHDADGNPIRPYRIRPDAEGELRIVLAEAIQQFGEPV